VRLEPPEKRREVDQGAGQAVDLVDDHDVNLSGDEIGEQAPDRRPVQGSAGAAPVVVAFGEDDPSFARLADNIRLAQVPLSVEGIDALIEPFRRGLASVYGAAPRRSGCPLC
jgi:hypothetical protein